MSTFKHLNWSKNKYFHQLMFLHLLNLALKFRDRRRKKFLFIKEGFEETFSSI